MGHTVCPHCIDKPLHPKSVCRECCTRCEDCNNTGLWNNQDEGPCPGKCGFREVTFEGADTAQKFGSWLFTDQHKYFKVVAHNMKGYDGYFLLEYLIDQSMGLQSKRPQVKTSPSQNVPNWSKRPQKLVKTSPW